MTSLPWRAAKVGARTIVGIPLAAQHLKLVKVALLPFGHVMRELKRLRSLMVSLTDTRFFLDGVCCPTRPEALQDNAGALG